MCLGLSRYLPCMLIRILYNFLLSTSYATCSSHFFLLDFVTLTVTSKKYNIRRSVLCILQKFAALSYVPYITDSVVIKQICPFASH